MRLTRSSLLLLTLTFGLQTQVFAQRSAAPVPAIGGIPIMTSPGTYNVVNQGQIMKYQLDFSKITQKQDQADYTRYTEELNKAYLDLYGSCPSANYQSCTGFQKLYQLSILSATQQTAGLPVSVLTNAIREFQQKRDNFLQRLSAIEVVNNIWDMKAQNTQNQTGVQTSAVGQVYQRGSLNMRALTDTYRTSVANMEKTAQGYTYTYFTGVNVVTTAPGKGLDIPQADLSPEMAKQRLALLTAQTKLSPADLQKLDAMQINVGTHMVRFVDTNGKKLVWYTQGQQQETKNWVSAVENQTRLLHYVRAVYCMPIGVPAISMPEPSRFNLDFFKRGLDESQFRIANAAEHNSAYMRETKSRLERVFVKMQSESGELNTVEGPMAFLHRLNSTFTWHNQVQANLSVIKILHDMYDDELDLLAMDASGCDRVRTRYYARYGSLRDSAFAQNVVQRYLEGAQIGGEADPTINSFIQAGQVILTKGLAYSKRRAYLRDNPSTSLASQAIDLDPSLR